MLLISIHPFASRKMFLLAIALLGLSSAFCFADSLFMARHYTPSHDQEAKAKRAVKSQGRPEAFLIRPAFESADTKVPALGAQPLSPLRINWDWAGDGPVFRA
jgi:hypothetical protein